MKTIKNRMEIPANFSDIFAKYKNKELTLSKCLAELGITKSRFYRMVKEYEKANQQLEIEQEAPAERETLTAKILTVMKFDQSVISKIYQSGVTTGTQIKHISTNYRCFYTAHKNGKNYYFISNPFFKNPTDMIGRTAEIIVGKIYMADYTVCDQSLRDELEEPLPNMIEKIELNDYNGSS